MKNNQILQGLELGKAKAFRRLYSYYPAIRKWLKAAGCPKADMPDIFQEALLVLCEKQRQNDFKLTCTLETYLFSVSKFIYYNKARKDKKASFEDLNQHEIEASNDLEELLQKEEKLSYVFKALDLISERCKKVLMFFYLDKKSMQEIANALGFANAKVAKNQKYKCLTYAKQKALELAK